MAAALLSVVAAGIVACSPVALLNGAAPARNFHRIADVPYGAQPRQMLDVYLPTRHVENLEAAPIVVFFYGGSWRSGAREDYVFVGEALAASGYVAVIADYRLAPAVRFPVFIEDAAAAVRWARDHAHEYGADPRRLFVMGHSAGAHIALMLATDAHYLAAVGLAQADLAGVIGLAGPYDFLPFTSRGVAEVFDPPARWPLSQPINFVSGREPPLWLGTGDEDDIVSPRNTVSFARKVRTAGGQVTEIHFPKLGHRSLIAALAAPLRDYNEVLADIQGFIAGRTLIPDAAPSLTLDAAGDPH